ncbi:hypothetical protein QE152_g7698 [Popillia japonica]|uniref:Uncharacterized protein n=1 Tax=Popillia japonica TaxID=7064 RepID=A0AAW1MDX9_POPJA
MDFKKNQNLSFKDLNNLLDQWIGDTLDSQEVFKNQAEYANQHLFEVGTHHGQLQQINGWLNVLRYHNQRLETDLQTTDRNLTILENSIQKLEEKLPQIEDLREIDPVRTQLHDWFDNVFASLQQWTELNDVVTNSVCQVEADKLKNPAEQLARIIKNQLETLEGVEIKLYQMMTCIAEIDTKKVQLWKKSQGLTNNFCV